MENIESVTKIKWKWHNFGNIIEGKCFYDNKEVSRIIKFSEVNNLINIKNEMIKELESLCFIKFE